MTQVLAPQRHAPILLAVASMGLAIALTAVQVAAAVAVFPASRAFRDELELGRSAADVFTAYDAVVVVLFPVALAAYIVTCLWLQVARTNTAFINPVPRHARGPVWVWLGWWVPIVSFWFPFQVVRDIQAGSRTALPRLGLAEWWGPWLAWVIGNQITSKLASSDQTDMVAALPTVEVLTTLALTAACVQWCRLVRGITADQHAALTPA
jgi:hypothetical protein